MATVSTCSTVAVMPTILRVFAQAKGQQEPSDCVCLDYERRQKSRQRVFAASGQELALLLPRGTRLTHGSLLEAEDSSIIRVVATSESLSRVESRDPSALARAAYHLGNRHVALEIGDGYVAYQRDHVLDTMLRQLGFEVHAVLLPFCPEPGAYQHHEWDSPFVVQSPSAAEAV